MSRLPEWQELTQEEQSNSLAQLEELLIDAEESLEGLKQTINQEFVINSRLNELKGSIIQQGQHRKQQRLKEERSIAEKQGKYKATRTIKVPAMVTDSEKLETVIQEFQAVKQEILPYREIEVTIQIED